MKPLEGKVALVAGASRGAGRGIARMLGEAGATVYCTARTSRKEPGPSGRTETIEETAEMVAEAGGEGIAVRVDHADSAAVAALFRRVKRERKRLDVLVLVLAAAQVADWRPFWKQSYDTGRAFIEAWLWPHLATAHHAAKLMEKQGSGLIVEISDGDTIGYRGPLFYDLLRTSLVRLASGLAEELAPRGVTALSITPGFMRTETVLDYFGATEETWQEVAETNPAAKRFLLSGSETPCFVGRAIAALAADPGVAAKSGGLFGSWELSDEYGFEDVDGRRPHWGRAFAEHLKTHQYDEAKTPYRWELVRAG
jgi:NAD(P)-dependent dehydrogenase (short-subunit alcohol dehydrogenase family)